MIIFSILYGLFFIGFGFFVKAFPESIAGYNTLNDEEKKNIDIEGLSTMMKYGFIVIGLLSTTGYLLFLQSGFLLMAILMLFIPVMGGIATIINLAPRYGSPLPKKRKRIIINLIIILISGFVISGMSYSYIPTETNITDEEISFSGAYGFDIPIREISDVDLKARIPDIRCRTNGYELGTVLKGKFRLESYGICNLFLRGTEGPYLIITFRDGAKTIINNAGSLKTEEDYYTLTKLIDQ